MSLISATVATRYLAFASGVLIAVNRSVFQVRIVLPPAGVDDIILDGMGVPRAPRGGR